jgi:hypothetical protein
MTLEVNRFAFAMRAHEEEGLLVLRKHVFRTQLV